MGLQNRIDPPRSFTPEKAQQWLKLLEMIESELAGTGLENTLFVDPEDGDNDTAERGSLSFKYATIMGAIADAESGDTILLAPGTYTEDVVWPGTLENIVLQGLDAQNTTITNATAVATVRVVPTVDTVLNVTIKDVTIENTSTLACLLFDGSSDLNLGNGGKVRLQGLSLSTNGALALDVDVVGYMELFDFQTDQNLAFDQVGEVLCSNFRANDISIENDPAGAVPNAGFVGLVVTDSVLNDITVANLGTFSGATDVQVGDLTGFLLTDVAAPVGGRSIGAINFWGAVLGNVGVTFDFDDLSDQIAVVLDHARISGTFAFGAGVTGSNVATCRALNAEFYNTSANSITADSMSLVDIRGSQFAQPSLRSLNSTGETAGTIDRTCWYIDEAVGGGAASHAIEAGEFGPPLPAGTTDYTVCVAEALLADLPIEVTSASKAAQTFDRIKTADGQGVRYLVTRPYD